MIAHEEQLGWDRDLTVSPGVSNTTSIMTLTLRDAHPWGDEFTTHELLDRPDVARLRDLCEEALA